MKNFFFNTVLPQKQKTYFVFSVLLAFFIVFSFVSLGLSCGGYDFVICSANYGNKSANNSTDDSAEFPDSQTVSGLREAVLLRRRPKRRTIPRASHSGSAQGQ